MSRRAGAALALLGCGLLLLTTTQPWARTVTEAAAGAPRSRGVVAGADLVPWLAPVALVTGVAVVAGLTGLRWARGVAALAALAVVAGSALGVLTATSAGQGGGAGEAVVSAVRTGWLWAGAVASVGTGLGTLLWCRPGGPDRAPRPPLPRPAADDGEAERRRAAADWRDLTEGRDPTDP